MLYVVVALGVLVVVAVAWSRARSSETADTAMSETPALPDAIPAPPMPILPAGMFINGQVWRWDGRWQALLPADTDPVHTIFELPGDGVYVVAWTGVYRLRGDEVVVLHRTPGRPRLNGGCGDPRLGVFATGDRGLVLRIVDGAARVEQVPPEAQASPTSSVCIGAGRVFVGTMDGHVLTSSGDGRWIREATPCDSRVYLTGAAHDGQRAFFISECGKIVAQSGTGWVIEHEHQGQLKDIAVCDGQLFAVAWDGTLLRSRGDGAWTEEKLEETLSAVGGGRRLWLGTNRSSLLLQTGQGWVRTLPGRSGTVQAIYESGGALYVGVEFFIESTGA